MLNTVTHRARGAEEGGRGQSGDCQQVHDSRYLINIASRSDRSISLDLADFA
jgi:hypothetical protein